MEEKPQKNSRFKYVLPALFDVRPVNAAGSLDLDKVKSVKSVLNLKGFQIEPAIEVSKNILEIKLKQENKPIKVEVKTEVEENVLSSEEKARISKMCLNDQTAVLFTKGSLEKQDFLTELEEVESYDQILENYQPELAVSNDDSDENPQEDSFQHQSDVAQEEIERLLKDPEEAEEPENNDEPANPQESKIDFNELAKPPKQDLKIEQFYAPEEPYFPEVLDEEPHTHLASFKEESETDEIKPKKSRSLIKLVSCGLLTALAVPGIAWLNQGFEAKNEIVVNNQISEIQTNEPDLPQDIKSQIIQSLDEGTSLSETFLSFLSDGDLAHYLLIIQDNSKMRATGGFISTYGLLTAENNHIENLFFDDALNADSQLHEKIIPPRPIQKISTAWSMHDANWFADFPTSAQKISWFYEETGGGSIDGIVSVTPTAINQLSELAKLDGVVKYETDYMLKLVQVLDNLPSEEKKKAAEIIFNNLEEKHILFYFNNPDLQRIAAKEGWTGALLKTEKDYFSVVSSRIDNFSDSIIEENINHETEIQKDGSVIVTLSVTRENKGNSLEFNYMRIYVPLDSQLLSVHGHSVEQYHPLINYSENDFKADSLVSAIENSMTTDITGVHIFRENDKTVFGNWVYAGSGKKAVVTYKYKLPFKISLTETAGNYSLLAQKQSGSLGSSFSHKLILPENWQILNGGFFEGDLKTDKFLEATIGVK